MTSLAANNVSTPGSSTPTRAEETEPSGSQRLAAKQEAERIDVTKGPPKTEAHQLSDQEIAQLDAEQKDREAKPYETTGKTLMAVGGVVAMFPPYGTIIGACMIGVGAVLMGVGSMKRGDTAGGVQNIAGGVGQGVSAGQQANAGQQSGAGQATAEQGLAA